MKKILSLLVIVSLLFTMGIAAYADEEKFATVEALQFDREPTIDGVVTEAEWGQPTVANINYATNTQTDVLNPSQDLSFDLWLRYTYEGFYVAVVTPDESHHNAKVLTNPSQIWDGDCLQIRLDQYGCTVDQNLTPSTARDRNWDETYNEFAFALDNEGKTRSYSWHGVTDHGDLETGNGRYKIVHANKITTYELFIPWEDILQQTPKAGVKLGCSIGLLCADGVAGVSANNDYSNWIEWGCGVFNGRDDNIWGSNRLIMAEKTLFGGALLTDPNAEQTYETKAPRVEETGDAAPFDITKTGARNSVETVVSDSNSLICTVTGEDPYLTFNVSGTKIISADNYRYLGLYLNTNVYGTGQVFFDSEAANDAAGLANRWTDFDYYEVEGNQVIVIDFQTYIEFGEWAGEILNVRLDLFDVLPDNYADASVEILGGAFFKTKADAQAFKVEGVTVTLADYEVIDETEPPAVTPAPGEQTAAPVEETEGSVSGQDTSAVTEPAGSGDDDGISPVVIAVIVCAVVIVAGVVIFIIIKKKKA